jgi:hypothetical protein
MTFWIIVKTGLLRLHEHEHIGKMIRLMASTGIFDGRDLRLRTFSLMTVSIRLWTEFRAVPE